MKEGTPFITLTLPRDKARAAELGFAVVFSGVVLVVFYSLISMNGLVLGNDPAVHLERAQIFLQTGRIPLANIGWTPPLYQIMLATIISFTGATALGQMIFLVKAVAVVINWLLYFSVYLIGAKFFGRKVGAVAAVLLFMCFPMYELNLWGGYTTVLGIAFLVLLLLYLPLAVKNFGYLLVTSIAAFSIVLSHQLAAFLAIFILGPVVLLMLVKSRGRQLKTLLFIILGGGVAFFLYYVQAMFPYLGGLIEHVLFAQRTTLYQVPATTLSAFIVNFGFVFVVGLCGVFLTFFIMRRQRRLALYLGLFLCLFVPLLLAESYLFGLLLPFQWFVYYLIPPLALFASAFMIFALEKFSAFYAKFSETWGKAKVRILTGALIILVGSLFLFRFSAVYQKIDEASVYYSTTDVKAFDAGVWLGNSFPGETTAVVTEAPGFWFRIISGKNVSAETNPVIERNEISESILDLAYELEHPHTIVRALEAKGDFTDDVSVSLDHVWTRLQYSSSGGDNVSYRVNNVYKNIALSNLTRETGFKDDSKRELLIRYFNDDLEIKKTIAMQDDLLPVEVRWTLKAIKPDVTNATLYVSVFFDLRFSFEEAFVPGVLNWQNPWEKPSSSQGNDWAVVDFTTMTDNYIELYDENAEVTFSLKFDSVPEWGNIGALASRQIDALRFHYSFRDLVLLEDRSFAYKILAFSKSSNPTVRMPTDLKDYFETKTSHFEVRSRDYLDYIRDNNVRFIVYDKNQLDTKMAHSKLLQLVYSNNRYVIFRIKT